jgi:hypothetical protein
VYKRQEQVGRQDAALGFGGSAGVRETVCVAYDLPLGPNCG